MKLCMYSLAITFMSVACTTPEPGPVLADAGTESMNRPEPEFGLSRQSLEHDGERREYLRYIPSSYRYDSEAAVLLSFHGGGGDAESQLMVADMRNLADAEGFLLIYPEGTLLDSGEGHWNPLPPGPNNKSDADDMGFTAALLDQLAQDYPFDASRVYATGYSNGAGFAYGLACYLSDRIAAVAPVSGSMYGDMRNDCAASHPTGIVIINGTEDMARPYDGYPPWFLSVDDAVSFWTRHNGTDSRPETERFTGGRNPVERLHYRGGAGSADVVRYKVEGGDHLWFDLDIDGADLNRVIWDVMAAHDQTGLR